MVCSRGPRAGIISPSECSRGCDRPCGRSADGAPRAQRHVLQLVRRGHRRRDAGLARDRDQGLPFASSVDNGWLGAALWVVRNAVPGAADLAVGCSSGCAGTLSTTPRPRDQAGSCTAGSSPSTTTVRGGIYLGTHIDGPDVWLTRHHYDTIVSETRITSYLGIMTGQAPPALLRRLAHLPGDLRLELARDAAVGVTRNYLGLDVYEGAYAYRGMNIVPGWGGSMFEDYAQRLRPRGELGPRSWGRDHPLHVRAQIEHGMVEAGYGYWGFSPSSDPFANYREYGVDALGLNPEGYFSDAEKTNYDPGLVSARGHQPDPGLRRRCRHPARRVLGDDARPAQSFTNLMRIEEDLGAYGPAGSTTPWPSAPAQSRTLPGARPGDGHRRHRQRRRPQRPAQAFSTRPVERVTTDHRHGGVRRQHAVAGGSVAPGRSMESRWTPGTCPGARSARGSSCRRCASPGRPGGPRTPRCRWRPAGRRRRRTACSGRRSVRLVAGRGHRRCRRSRPARIDDGVHADDRLVVGVVAVLHVGANSAATSSRS